MGDEEFINDSLQASEDAEARRQAEEDALDANGLNESLDVDPQNEPYDSSAQFTNYNGGDAFDMTGNHEANEVGTNDGEDDDEANEADNDFDGDDGDFDNDAKDFDGDEEDNDGNDDSDEDEEDDDDEENDDGNEGDEPEQNQSKEKADNQQSNKVKKKGSDGPIKWKKGDKITLELLYQVWNECKFIEKIKSLVDAANKAVMEAINTIGPNLALRLNDYISKITDKTKDTIDCLLDLSKNAIKRMLFTAVSSVEALFDQQWIQPTIIVGLPGILKTAIETNPLKSILNAIFAITVPILNKRANKK